MSSDTGPNNHDTTNKEIVMTTSSDETKRVRQRFDVDIKAELSLAGDGTQEQQCRITNLSASGACLHFNATTSCKLGMHVDIKISIPETIMHIPNSGEIMWVKQQRNEIHAGVSFKNILSEIMMQRLVKNGIPENPYNPQ
jgi:hypothetical protein